MSEQILNGNLHLLMGFQVLPGQEFRDIVTNRVHQPHLPGLDELHDGNRGAHALGYRGQVEHRLFRHGNLFRNQRFASESLFIHQGVPPDHAHNGPGNVPGSNGSAHRAINEGEPLRIHAD